MEIRRSAILKLICAVMVLCICFALGSCKLYEDIVGAEDEVTVDADGSVIVNGEKTEYKVHLEDKIEVDDEDHLVVNGVKTEYEVNKEDVVTTDDEGYVIVNGEKTEYKIHTADQITVSTDGYLVVNGVETEYQVNFDVHKYGAWKLYNEDAKSCEEKFYYRECSHCDGVEWKRGGAEDHSFGSKYLTDETYHWKDCANCDAVSEKAEHTLSGSSCSICGVSLGATDGIVYEVSADRTYATVMTYTGSATQIRIAEKYNGYPVKVIYDEAFINQNYITSVLIPDSVETIGKAAFKYCASLKSVTVGKSVVTIGEEAFGYCSYLANLTLGSSVRSIGKDAFYSCTQLQSVVIPDSVTSIGSTAFGGCSRLGSVTLGNACAEISSSAFERCNSDLYTEVGSCKYAGDSENPYAILVGVTNKNLTTYEINAKTKIITSMAFSGCSRMTSLTIPDGVIHISSDMISSLSGITSIAVSIKNTKYKATNNVLYTKDGKTLLRYLSANTATSFTVPNTVTTIAAYAFYYCKNLTSVTVSDSVVNIEARAFAFCENLQSVTIGSSVKHISNYAFYECDNLNEAIFKNTSGWCLSDSSDIADKIEDIIDAVLSDELEAAWYLRGRYYYHWHRV